MSARDTYIEKMKLQLDESITPMDALEQKAKIARNNVQEKYLIKMNNLREQSHLALDKLDELKSTGEKSWKSIVAETEKVRDAFIQSCHYFKSQL